MRRSQISAVFVITKIPTGVDMSRTYSILQDPHFMEEETLG